MRLAIRNILHDRLRFLLTVAGIAFAAFLMVFQGSLLAGFERSASRVIDSIDADLWVMARGVQAFDFAPELPSDYAGIVRGVPGIRSVEPVATGIVLWHRPNGTRKTVVAIGCEDGLPGEFPVRPGKPLLPDDVIVDASDLRPLGIAQMPDEVEVGAKRTRVANAVSGFGSFLGSPYVFGRLGDTRRRLGLQPRAAMFLVLRLEPGYSAPAAQAALRERAPELDVIDKREFSARAKAYWTMQTGAGGALLTAAVLGFAVGVLIVSQSVYATTMENVEEFATFKALGASALFVTRIVVTQALLTSAAGCLVGTAAAVPAVNAARGVIAWVYTPWQLLAAMAVATPCLAIAASIMAARAALSVEPGRVFRA